MNLMVGNIGSLKKTWDTMDMCYKRPETYIAVVLRPVTNFRHCKATDNAASVEFCSLPRVTSMGAKVVDLLKMLVNEQVLSSIIGMMPGLN
jgi:hypothetical protein